jgi:hypothetical protein
LHERRDDGRCFPIVRGSEHEHADAPHPPGLLRARGERPRGRCAAEQRDEIASLHAEHGDFPRERRGFDGESAHRGSSILPRFSNAVREMGCSLLYSLPSRWRPSHFGEIGVLVLLIR